MKRIFIFILMILSFVSLYAQSRSEPGEHLTVKIAVMGLGDELYFWWGHIALIIEDSQRDTSRFYDYGLFSFESEHFFTNFALGRLLYSCGVSDTSRSISPYVRENRDITIYTLDLDPAARERVRNFAEENVKPENRNYFYHHFKDNCATRIRDIFDVATDGQFKAQYGEAPGRFTLRQHIRRSMWFSPVIDWFLNFLMGQDIDQPITVWQEMFLPSEIGNNIQEFQYNDAAGKSRKFFTLKEIVNKSIGRYEVLDEPRPLWPATLIVGLIIAAFFIICIRIQQKKPVLGRIILGISQSFLGFFFGIAGTLLYFMTFFTDHDYTYHNANILFISPLLLAAIPLGIIVARNKNPAPTRFSGILLKALWTYMTLGCILSMLIKLSPAFYQQNQPTQALVLPFALVLSFIPAWGNRIINSIKKR
ncbi:membrane protein [Spirochaetia bacterium]|nr:membrane protein [Spirochaetia bacterium]